MAAASMTERTGARMAAVSVVIPVYNAERYLRKALASVREQTLSNVDIICVDDGSTDDSPSILRAASEEDPRIRVRCAPHRGAGEARNSGIRDSWGEYIAFMDADDRYHSRDALQALYSEAVAHGADVCGGGISHLYKGGVTTRNDESYDGYTFSRKGFVSYDDYQFDYGYTRFLYRRTFLMENEILFPPYARYQDPPFFVRAMIAAGRFYAITEPVYCYQVGHKAISWDEEKTAGLLDGLCDVLEMSQRHRLARLHRLAVLRAEQDWSAPLLAAARAANAPLVSKIYRLNSKIDISLLAEAGEPVCSPYMLAPLIELARGRHSALVDGRIREVKDGEVDVAEQHPESKLATDAVSWRIGRAITFLPRMARKLYCSIRDNGFAYVWQRLRHTVRRH